MKKGIALFSTLMILVLVIMLMSVALKNTTNIKKSTLQDRYLIQENLTMFEAIKLVETQIVAKLPKQGEARVELQQTLFSTPLTIQDSVTNSTITISMKANDAKVNINFLNSKDGAKFFLKIFNRIDVKEPEILIEILLANITNDIKYRDEYKIPLNQLDQNFGYITSFDQFKEMLDIYVQNSDDTEVYNIDFENYFSFYTESGKKYNRFGDNLLDINYIKPELIDSIVALDNSIRKNIEEKDVTFYNFAQMNLEETDKEKLENSGFGFITQNIILEINITSINNKVKYTLNYNLENKKISKISMDRWIY